MRPVVVAPYGSTVRYTNSHQVFARATGCSLESVQNLLGATQRHKKDYGHVIGVFDGNHATLVHECVHVALFMLESHGVDGTQSSGEPLAYMVDWLYSLGAKTLKL